MTQGCGLIRFVTAVNFERCAVFAHFVQLDNGQLVVLGVAISADAGVEVAVEYFLLEHIANMSPGSKSTKQRKHTLLAHMDDKSHSLSQNSFTHAKLPLTLSTIYYYM